MFLSLRSGLITAVAALTLATAAAAQTFEQLPAKPYDPSWSSEAGVDRTMDCSLLPESGPDPYLIGMPAALAAAERRELALGGFGTTLNRADREPDSAYIPALKRIADQYRCANYHIKVALVAIEAAGEPRAYFLDLVRNWRYNDHLAAAAMDALAVREDSAAYAPLRDVILTVPQKGRFGVDLTSEFNTYVQGLRSWAWYRNLPIPQQIDVGASVITSEATQGPVVRGVRGDSVGELENYNGSSLHAIPRRLLRQLAQVYPSAVEASLRAYADTAQVKLLARGVTASQIPLYLRIIERNGRETAFPSNGPPLPPAVTSAAARPAVCIEASPTGTKPFRLTAVFSYSSAESVPVRVLYGPGNTLTAPPGALSPEVFFPDAVPNAPGRTFRVPLAAGGTAAWTLLGQTVTATSTTRRCGAPVAPLHDGPAP